MKRKSSRRIHQSMLRSIRDATGLSQEKFAARLGIPKSTIENIEMARSTARFDKDLVYRLAAFAGVVPASIEAGYPRGADGRPYDKASFDLWKSIKWEDKAAEDLIQLAAASVAEMLRATVFAPNRDRRFHMLNELLVELDQFVHSAVKRRSLKESINAVLEEKMVPEEKELEMHEIQKRLGDRWEFLEKNAPHLTSLPPSTRATFTRNTTPLFSRSVMFPRVQGQFLVHFGTRDFIVDSMVKPITRKGKPFRWKEYFRDSFSPKVPQVKQGELTKAPESDHARAAISRPPRVSGPTPKTSRPRRG